MFKKKLLLFDYVCKSVLTYLYFLLSCFNMLLLLVLVLMVIWFIISQDFLCQMNLLYFDEIMHFLVFTVFFFLFHANNTLTWAHLTLSEILKVPSIHKPITLRITSQTLIILLKCVMKIGKKRTWKSLLG